MLILKFLLFLSIYSKLHAVLIINVTNLYDVIVLGGGVSGLSTMSSLATAGLKNTLLIEGQNRLGGRIFTTPVTLANGTISHVEYGATVRFKIYIKIKKQILNILLEVG